MPHFAKLRDDVGTHDVSFDASAIASASTFSLVVKDAAESTGDGR